jgi:hypothetical protein
VERDCESERVRGRERDRESERVRGGKRQGKREGERGKVISLGYNLQVVICHTTFVDVHQELPD